MICQENMTLPVIMVTGHCLTPHWLWEICPFFSILWHFLAFGRWEEENQEAARMWHFHWFLMNEDREINNNCNLYNKDFVGSQSVSGVQSKSQYDTLWMTSSWWLRMRDTACMCITQCQWSEHYLCAGRCCYKLSGAPIRTTTTWLTGTDFMI